MAVCVSTDSSGALVTTTEAPDACAEYVLMQSADWDVIWSWSTWTLIFDPSTPEYWAMVGGVMLMMTVAYVFREIGRFTKRG